jgi:hypothetical protein
MSRARGSFRGLFNPVSSGLVAGWLRLSASTQSGGEYTNLVDVLNSNPAVQADTDRRCAVSTSANGLLTMVFDGSDMYQWPLSAAINNMTTKLGFWLWFKPASVASVQRLLNATIAAGAVAGLEKFSFYTNNRTLVCEVYVSNTTGRIGTTASNVLTAGQWHSIYLQYDSSRGGDANLAMYVNGVQVSLNYSNIGVGATLDVLQAPTGNILVGSFNNSDTPVQAIDNGGEFGPNPVISFNDNLTPQLIAAFHAFEAPT